MPCRKRDGTVDRDALTHPCFAGHGHAGLRVDMRGSGDSQGMCKGEHLKQEQDDALALLRAHVAEHCPPGVTAEVMRNPGRGDPFQTPAGHNASKIAQDVLAEVYGRPPYLTRPGGSIPVLTTLRDALGVHAVMFGLSHADENLHAHDEFFRLDVFRKDQQAYGRLLEKPGTTTA